MNDVRRVRIRIDMASFESSEDFGSTAADSGGANGAPGFGWGKIATQIALLAIRTIIALSKLLLAVYTARYLGLGDLGIYGLLVAGTTIVPAVVGLGMTDWIARKVVDLPRDQALPLIAGRSALTFSIHAIVQPLLFVLDVLLGGPIQLRLAVMAGLILMLENLSSEASDLLVARRHIFLSNLLTCSRMGIWPLVVIVIGLLYPQTRSLDALLLVWIAALVANSLILLSLAVRKGRWRYMRPKLTHFVQQLRYSRALYLKDISATVGIFVDRFLISTFLGLELTGVYTFYWSVANVIHSLAVVGILQSQIAPLLAAGQKSDESFLATERHLQIEIGGWALFLSIGAIIFTPLLLPYLGRPLLQDYVPVLWLLLVATLLRVAADGYGFALLALHRDRAIALIAACGAIASAALNVILTPLAGLWGAAVAASMVAAGLFVVRFYLTRSHFSPSRAGPVRGD